MNLLQRDLDHVLSHTEDLWADARGERFFVTGGTSFVGTWLIESLLWANRRLSLGLSVEVLTRDPDAFRSRCAHLTVNPALILLSGELSSFAFPCGAFAFVVHAACGNYKQLSAERPVGDLVSDIEGGKRILDFASVSRTRRLLFTSSGAVYGNQPPGMNRIPESYSGAPPVSDPASAYGHTKRALEFLCSSAAQACGFDSLIARLFTFSGPYLPLNRNYAAGNFIRDVLESRPVRIYGDGTPFRSYMYAADLAIWLWTILFRGKSASPYNVGSPDAISIADVAKHVVAMTRPATSIEFAVNATPSTPPARYVPDVERAERELGLQIWVPLDEGLSRMYDWHRRRRALDKA